MRARSRDGCDELFDPACFRQMLFHLAPFVSLAGPLDGADGGPLAWVDDQTTYNFTTSPEYGDSSYPLGYNELWSPQWQHFVSWSCHHPYVFHRLRILQRAFDGIFMLS